MKNNSEKKVPLYIAAFFLVICAAFYFILKKAPAPHETQTEEILSQFDISSVPEFSGEPFFIVNGNKPFFTDTEIGKTSFEKYGGRDPLGRCTVCTASVGKDTMPDSERENISEIKPSGWQNAEYGFIDGGYLYNRCHLIGFQLTGENLNPENIITGTRFLNVMGMLPFENEIAKFVKATGNHVLYRVTPVFEGENLLCSGVLLEAESVEDNGAGVKFCVYCYNAQPSVGIDYKTGENEYSGFTQKYEYTVNTSSKKFHLSGCESGKTVSERNKLIVTATREELLKEGYSPCGACDP